jgi:hypothetical protein
MPESLQTDEEDRFTGEDDEDDEEAEKPHADALERTALAMSADAAARARVSPATN